MTLRNDVYSMLTGSAGDADVPGDGSDLADLPAELIGTVIGHFADTAPIAVADELAPIVMATGPVPFDPALDGVEPIDDPRSAFGRFDVDPSTLDDDAREFDDPSDFDVDSTPGTSVAAEPAAADDAEEADLDESFGSGSLAAVVPDPPGSDVQPIDDALDVDDNALSFVAVEVADPVDGFADEAVIDFDPVDLDTDDLDPMDDDVDLAD